MTLGSELCDGFDDVELGAVVDLREERLALFREQLKEFVAVHALTLRFPWLALALQEC